MKRLEEIEARVNAATPGPWEWEDTERQRWGVTAKGLVANKGDVIHADDFYLDGKERDLDFISHSRDDIPFLLDKLKRAQEIIQYGRDACDCGCQCGYYDATDTEGNAVLSTCFQCASADFLKEMRNE